MRFCLVSTQEHWGGGESLLAAIGAELVGSGHLVSWIVRHGCEVQRRATAEGADILHAINRRGANLSDWLAIRRVLRAWKPDVVVLNDSHAVPLVGSAALFCGSPRPLRLAMKHTIFRLNSPLKYRLLSDRLVCVSQAALQTVLKGGLSPRHALVVHGGCPPLVSHPEVRCAVRKQLALTDQQLFIVCVGSLLECKGHRELIEAIRLLADSHPQLVLGIAGEGEQRQLLEQQIEAAGLSARVHLLGYRDDVARLLDAADLVVHPSHAEGLSLVLIQAQMLGKPIVATAVGGACEVLAADSPQCSSWIAEAHDPRSLADQMAAALAAIASRTAQFEQKLQATAARMHANFTVAQTASELSALAERMLKVVR